jgi:Family of unknown function (DUF6599)
MPIPFRYPEKQRNRKTVEYSTESEDLCPMFRKRTYLLVVGLLYICSISLAALAPVCTMRALAETPQASSMNVTLPQSEGGWTLSGSAKKVEPDAIFDYMDGAGELYLGYRFKYLDVYEYTNPSKSEILVELYWMESPDDAYGLLSGDWGGDAADLSSTPGRTTPSIVRALYGAGLLRIWSGNLYARVLTYEESDESKQAVLALGKAIVAGRPEPSAPRLVQALPKAVGSQFALRADRTVYLRSHLVLNSVYFLSSENLLDLGLDCELAAAAYRRNSGADSSKQVRVLLVRYPEVAAARKALAHFQRLYLSGKSSEAGDRGVVSIEDGYAGFILSGRGLGLVFEAPDDFSVGLFLESSKQALENMEAVHE